MDFKRAIRGERAMLKSIVALLLALADLAELAHGRSRAACRLVFWMLRPAETAAWTLVACPLDAPPFVPSHDVRAEMMHLALRFRELACILERQIEFAFSCRPENNDQSGSSPYDIRRNVLIVDLVEAIAFAGAVPIADTS